MMFGSVSPALKAHIIERVKAAYADFVEDVSLEKSVSELNFFLDCVNWV